MKRKLNGIEYQRKRGQVRAKWADGGSQYHGLLVKHESGFVLPGRR